MTTLACVAQGRLHLVEGSGEPREIESAFAERVRSRERQIRAKNAWKTQGTGARFMGAGRAVLWGENDDALPMARFIGVAPGRVGAEIFYAITTGVISGIFGRSPAGDEQRVFHDAETHLSDLSFSRDLEAFAFAVQGKGGSSAITILADDGHGVRTVTQGDAIDRAPRWMPGKKREIVYASAAIGRTQQGVFAGLAPFAIHRLSLDDGNLEVVVSDPAFDYVAPVPVSESAIYAIRRPYKNPHAPPSIFRVLVDAVLVPFRLLFALFQFLSFFTTRYTGKPLLTSGNAQQKAADAHQMSVWGNLVDVRQAADRAAADEPKGTASSGYELVLVTAKGVETVARGALAFDVARDGTIFFSDGRDIKRLASGKTERVAKLAHVEQIAVCD
jgi:hypothetical protein